MMNPPIKVDYTARFRTDIKRLYRKYRRIRDDVQSFIDALEKGNTPGDRVSGVKQIVYKARIRNSDVQRGKSGGYRVIYYIKTADNIILLTIYSKSEAADIPTQEIRRIIEEYQPPE